ncbi:MAG: hypothetical protein ACREHF_04435 [Rhizomicrobium sp.]
MHKYPLLSADALLASTAQTNAQSFAFASAGGASYCDSGAITTNGVVRTWTGRNAPRGAGTRSTLSALKDLIAASRGARKN